MCKICQQFLNNNWIFVNLWICVNVGICFRIKYREEQIQRKLEERKFKEEEKNLEEQEKEYRLEMLRERVCCPTRLGYLFTFREVDVTQACRVEISNHLFFWLSVCQSLSLPLFVRPFVSNCCSLCLFLSLSARPSVHFAGPRKKHG